MMGNKLPENYIENSVALLKKKRSRVASSATLPTVKPVTPAPSATPTMAKTLHDYSIPTVANVPVGPTINVAEPTNL